MSELKEIKASMNAVQLVGTLKEVNIGIVNEERDIYYGEGKKKKLTCDAFVKLDWQSPAFLIEVNGQDIGVDMNGISFGIPETRLKDDGTPEDGGNKSFKALQTIMGFKPKSECKEGETPTRVIVEGFIRPNEYAKDDKFHSFPVVTAFKLSHTAVPDEDKNDCVISGVIRSLIPEVKVEDDSEIETGRLKIELFYFDKNKNTYPMTIMVENDLADAVSELYEAGNSCKVYYEVVNRRVGGRQTADEGGVGRRKANISTGFNVTEYSLFNCTDPFEEEHEFYVGMDEMKEATEARKLMIETKIQEAKDRKNKSGEKENVTASPKGASKGVGRREFKGTEGAGSPF